MCILMAMLHTLDRIYVCLGIDEAQSFLARMQSTFKAQHQ